MPNFHNCSAAPGILPLTCLCERARLQVQPLHGTEEIHSLSARKQSVREVRAVHTSSLLNHPPQRLLGEQLATRCNGHCAFKEAWAHRDEALQIACCHENADAAAMRFASGCAPSLLALSCNFLGGSHRQLAQWALDLLHKSLAEGLKGSHKPSTKLAAGLMALFKLVTLSSQAFESMHQCPRSQKHSIHPWAASGTLAQLLGGKHQLS